MGRPQDFGDGYFHAGVDEPTSQTSAPLYLAANGIDVWRIDLAWTLVPEETTDLSFMKDWDVERDVDHILASMSIARWLRGLTGQGFRRMNLLGFSYSTALAYSAAGRETQQRWRHRTRRTCPGYPGVQIDEARCGEKDVSIDDHLSEIMVPILYIGAGGGLGAEEGEWTTSQTASDDVTIYEVSLQPENRRNIDFDHADLFVADNAPKLVWKGLSKWLIDHNSRSPRADRFSADL